MKKNKYLVLLSIFGFLFQIGISAFADTLYKSENNCVRTYIYRNRTYSVDSSRKLDGEGLRKVLKSIPQSESLLNSYQQNIKTSNITAYTGTAGLLASATGFIYYNSLNKDQHVGKHDLKWGLIFPGISVLLTSYIFGRFLLIKNEKRLESAVTQYNEMASKPEQIQVSLEPLSNPDGGQIKTIVPF